MDFLLWSDMKIQSCQKTVKHMAKKIFSSSVYRVCQKWHRQKLPSVCWQNALLSLSCMEPLYYSLRNIAWGSEVVKKMKWDGAAQARCTCRDVPSPKYQSSELWRPFICVYGSKKRYLQHKNTGNSVVCTQFMWDNEIILCSYFYFRY